MTTKKSTEQRYTKFNQRNPHVMERLRDLATAAFVRGRTRIGIKHLIEVLRWDESMATRPVAGGAGEFKLDNNFTALYARDLMAAEPEFAHLFDTRKRAFERANITRSTSCK